MECCRCGEKVDSFMPDDEEDLTVKLVEIANYIAPLCYDCLNAWQEMALNNSAIMELALVSQEIELRERVVPTKLLDLEIHFKMLRELTLHQRDFKVETFKLAKAFCSKRRN